MYCSKCGQENDNDSKFCLSCGNPMEGVESVNAQQTPGVEQTQSVEPTPSVEQIPGFDPDPIFNQNPQPIEKKKNKKKMGFIVAAVVMAVVLIAGATIALAFPKIERAVLGETAYYLVQESSAFEDMFDAGTLSAISDPKSFSANSEVTVKVNDKYDEEINEIFNSLRITSEVDYDKSRGAFGVDAGVTFDKEELFNVGLDYVDNQLAFSSDLVKSSLLILEGDKKDDFINPSDAIKSVGKDLWSLLKDTVDKDNVKKTKDTFNDKQYDTVIFSFDGDDLDKLMADILKELKESEEMSEMLEGYFDMIRDIADEYGEDAESLDSYIDYLIDGFENYGLFSDLFDELNMKVFYGSRGKMVAREITVDVDSDTSIVITIESKINGKNTELKTTVDWKDSYFDENYKVEVVYSKATEGKGIDASLTCDISGDSDLNGRLFELNVKDLQSKSCNGVNTLCGSLYLSFDDGYDSFEINLTADVNKDSYDIDLDVDVEDTTISAAITTQLSKDVDVSKISIPNNCETDFEEYFDSLGEAISEKLYNTIFDFDDFDYDDYYDDFYDYYDDYYYDYYDYYDYDDYYDF